MIRRELRTIPLTSFDKPAVIRRWVDVEYKESDSRKYVCQRKLRKAERGTIDYILLEYELSPESAALSKGTLRKKRYYIKIIADRFGELRPDNLTSPMIHNLQAELSSLPGKANGLISVISSMMKFAIKRGYATLNPETGVSRLKIGDYKPWPKWVLDEALAVANPMDRLIIMTGLYSGQRISDCIRITHAMMASGMVELIQKKTKRAVYIPVHARWAEAVRQVPRNPETILYDAYGRPFRNTDTPRLRIKTILRSIGADNYVFHGLRKNATNHLAGLGLTHHQIATVTGMDIKTLVHYTKDIDNRRLAEQIARRIQAADPLSA